MMINQHHHHHHAMQLGTVSICGMETSNYSSFHMIKVLIPGHQPTRGVNTHSLRTMNVI